MGGWLHWLVLEVGDTHLVVVFADFDSAAAAAGSGCSTHLCLHVRSRLSNFDPLSRNC